MAHMPKLVQIDLQQWQVDLFGGSVGFGGGGWLVVGLLMRCWLSGAD
jgi:hypothetical protein